MARDFGARKPTSCVSHSAARAAIMQQLLRKTGWGRFVPDTKTAVDPSQDARQIL